jgi:hypothetical protein
MSDTFSKVEVITGVARRPDAVSLDQARLRMLFYLDWVSADLAFRAPPKDIAHAIKLGADRSLVRNRPGMPRRSQRGVRAPTGTQKEIARPPASAEQRSAGSSAAAVAGSPRRSRKGGIGKVPALFKRTAVASSLTAFSSNNRTIS